jgi:aminoglycoside 6'-N-acetyltransferase I
MPMRITPAVPADIGALQPLRSALWPGSHVEELLGPQAARAYDADYRIFLAHDEVDALIGFAEMTLRHDPVNGCETSPVAFLEGIYVVPGHRRQGIARALVEAAADWGYARGAREFASDTALDNALGHAFHHALGFEETERVVYYRRLLAGRRAS